MCTTCQEENWEIFLTSEINNFSQCHVTDSIKTYILEERFIHTSDIVFMPGLFTEATRVQLTAIQHLARIGYTYLGKISESGAEGNIDFSGCDLIDEDALKKVHKRSDIAKGDVLYASICPLGRSYLINKDPVGWDINESVFSIRPNFDVISSEFLSMFLKDSAVVEKASIMATGSIFKGIRIKELENIIFTVPAKNVMESFSKQIKNLIELEHKNTEETIRLTALRDKLLPLLMNGQVTIK